MSMNHHIITARDMMEDEAISPFSILDFLVPYNWVLSLGRTSINMCEGLLGHGFISKIISMFLKVIMFFVVVAFLWIPINLFYRAACFAGASLVRLCRGKGGKEGFVVNCWFVLGYVAIFYLFYIPIVFPNTIGYIPLEEVMAYVI